MPWIYHRNYTSPHGITEIEEFGEKQSITRTYDGDISGFQVSGEHDSLQSAKNRFRTTFKRLTGLEWFSRDSTPLHGYWIFLGMDYAETLTMKDNIVQLHPLVEPIMKMIFLSSHLKAYASSLKAAGHDVELNGTEKLRIGLACLEKHMQVRESNVTRYAEYKLEQISHEMITGSAEYSAKKNEVVKIELESFGLLLKLHDAKKILKNSRPPSLGLSRVAHALGVAQMSPGMSFHGYDRSVEVLP